MFGAVQNARNQAFGFPMRDTRAHVDQITAADQLFKRAHAQLRHQFAHFFGHEEEIIHRAPADQ